MPAAWYTLTSALAGGLACGLGAATCQGVADNITFARLGVAAMYIGLDACVDGQCVEATVRAPDVFVECMTACVAGNFSFSLSCASSFANFANCIVASTSTGALKCEMDFLSCIEGALGVVHSAQVRVLRDHVLGARALTRARKSCNAWPGSRTTAGST